MYPVLEVVPDLKAQFIQQKILILQAPPGAGKSTVLPLQILNEPWLQQKKIIMLEPRRLAARSVAMRMAQLLDEGVGETVGYRVRFENKVSAKTRIEVVTEGILTRMIQTDSALEDVGLVIFDEFHERSLQADLALALCLQVQSLLRDDLRLLIMSATLDGEKISGVLNNAPILTSLGRQYPITHRYINPDKDLRLTQNVARVIRKALQEQAGDVLVFLPGAGEIQHVQQLLEAENISGVVPLFGDLPFKKQQEAILPHPQGLRKIVLATSLAETSLTIEGITTVIDSGYARVPRFDPRSGLTRLETIRVTRDAADQRAGRAARLGPGVCYRLWPEATHHTLQPNRQPEILEADLASLVLELANWGVNDLNELTWITPPPPGAISQARELLNDLEALEENKITARGKEMLKLPTHPRIAHMLLSPLSRGRGAGGEGLSTDLASLLEERDPLPKEAGADLSLRVEVLRKWRSGERVHADRNVLERIERVAANWRRIFKLNVDNTIPADSEVGSLIAEAYPERIAQQQTKQSGRYKLANGRVVKLPEHDALARECWLAVAHLDAGSTEGKIFLAAPLDEADLQHRATETETVKWDSTRGIVAQLEKRIGNTVLSTKPLQQISETKRVAVLLQALRGEGLKLIGWDESHTEWQNRMLSLHAWRKDEAWPDVTTENLLATADEWLTPYLNNITKRSELQKLDLQNILMGLLPWDLQPKADKLAPVRLPVPSGSQIKLTYYNDGRAPVMEVRLQEMFGLLETPTINEGRTKILLHLLSPGYKPVQVTQDLKSFWQTTYHEVRKELRMRYPKHHWPEDPWTAEAVRGVKRK
ncbi:MAG TPA: ATP-dependent helicase HrpB [Cytophagales bacterium]|nr:ATP-dependent helicase HrpB [Cytophagales bacterium]HRG09773.1 ATP-dependent helicase HrpB [Cyclobacteriaceae bacterium]